MIWRVEHFKEIDSTNSWLVERANAGGEAAARIATMIDAPSTVRITRNIPSV